MIKCLPIAVFKNYESLNLLFVYSLVFSTLYQKCIKFVENVKYASYCNENGNYQCVLSSET